MICLMLDTHHLSYIINSALTNLGEKKLYLIGYKNGNLDSDHLLSKNQVKLMKLYAPEDKLLWYAEMSSSKETTRPNFQ